MLNLRALVCCLPVVVSGVAIGAQEAFNTSVESMLVSEANGECIFKPDPNGQLPSDVGLNCANAWLSLDCGGLHGSKSLGNTKFGMIQLAYVTNTPIRVMVDDLKVAGAYCVTEFVWIQ